MKRIHPISIVPAAAQLEGLHEFVVKLQKLGCISNYLETGESIYQCKVAVVEQLE